MKSFLLLSKFRQNILCFASQQRRTSIFSNTNENLIIPRVNLDWTEDKIIQIITNAAKSGGP